MQFFTNSTTSRIIRFFSWLFLMLGLSSILMMHSVHGKGGGGPILIKTDGKDGKKGNGQLIMLNGCSPMLIKGSDKKKKSQQMIIAGGGDCGGGGGKSTHHTTVQYIPQYMPYPVVRYVHTPPRYIYKHHYIRVPHIIIKKVPVPVKVPQYVPVPYEKKEIHLMYGGKHKKY